MGLYSRERDGGHAREGSGDKVHIVDQVLSGPGRDGVERHSDTHFGEGMDSAYAFSKALEPGEFVVECGNMGQQRHEGARDSCLAERFCVTGVDEWRWSGPLRMPCLPAVPGSRGAGADGGATWARHLKW